MQVQQRGQRMDVGPLLVFVHPRDLLPLRMGITTSRKVGKAVFRNRLRRLIRDAARRLLLPGAELLHFDIVFVAKKGLALDISQQEIDQALLTLQKRLQSFRGRKSANKEKPKKVEDAGPKEPDATHGTSAVTLSPTEKK